MNQTIIDQQHLNRYHCQTYDMYPHHYYNMLPYSSNSYSDVYNSNQTSSSLTPTSSVFLTEAQHAYQNDNHMYCESDNLTNLIVSNDYEDNNSAILHQTPSAQWQPEQVTQMILPSSSSTVTTVEPQNYNFLDESLYQQQQAQPEQSHQQMAKIAATALRRFEPAPSNSREQRNLAEKMRRDKINKLINELGKLVPFVVDSPKRVDKTSILRLTSVYLRIKQLAVTLKQLKYDDENSDNIPVESMIQLVCDQLGAFFMVLSTTGKIVMVSQMVETLLDRSYTDLMGQSIYDITHPDDHLRIKRQLTHNPPTTHVSDDTGNIRRNFDVRIVCSRSRSEPVSYERVSISGTLILDRYLVCMVKICKPTPLYEQLLEARKDEYVTRHFIDGTIINCDQRISVVAGYMTEEVTGLSAFRFIHREDVRWTMIALRQMYDRGESRGSSCYRLMTRTGKFIYLRTYGYLEVDKNGTVESFVCVNTLVSENEGQQLIRELKERYSALIHPASPLSLTNGESAATVEDPRQLDIAIQYLIHKLPVSPSPASPETKDCINNSDSSSPPPKRPCTESSSVLTHSCASSRPQQSQSQSQPVVIQSQQNSTDTYNNSKSTHTNTMSHDPQLVSIKHEQDEQIVDYQRLNQNTVINSPNSLLTTSMDHLPVPNQRPL